MNIYIYLVDDLRYDRLPKEIMEMGVTFKGIASGTSTRFSVPSIFTGVYPSTHGMRFSLDRIKGVTFFDLPINTAFNSYSETRRFDGKESALYWWTNRQNVATLEDMKPPFLFYEHNWQLHEYRKYACNAENSFELRLAYDKGVRFSLETFKSRVDYLQDKNLLDSTLIIFMSDHGEILGEHGGLYSHNFPICPELVYVPIVLIHSELEPKNVESGIARHIDIFPTIVDLLSLGYNDLFFEGSSLLRGAKEFGICEYKGNWGDVSSVWTRRGGFVKILDYRYPKIVTTAAYNIVKRWSLEPLKYFKRVQVYGEIDKSIYETELTSFLNSIQTNRRNYMLNRVRLLKRKKYW